MGQAKVCVSYIFITGIDKQLLPVSESFLVCSLLCPHVVLILNAHYSLTSCFFLLLHLPHPTQSFAFPSHYLFYSSHILTALKAFVALHIK